MGYKFKIRIMNQKIAVILILLSIFFYQHGVAQKANPDYRKLHYLSEEEMHKDFDASRDFFVTDPPNGPIRNVAEFEEMQSVLVRYPLGIPGIHAQGDPYPHSNPRTQEQFANLVLPFLRVTLTPIEAS